MEGPPSYSPRYQEVLTRRDIDEQAVWTPMRFADEPAERAPSQQITRLQRDDPRRVRAIAKGEFDRAMTASRATTPSRSQAAQGM